MPAKKRRKLQRVEAAPSDVAATTGEAEVADGAGKKAPATVAEAGDVGGAQRKAKRKKKAGAANVQAATVEAKPLPDAGEKAPKKRKAGAANVQGATVEAKSLPDAGEKASKKRKAADDAPDNTIFVDGVPYTWDFEKIRSLFARCGEVVDVRAPSWQDSGRLRGYAHVSFADPSGKKEALKMDGIKVGAKGRYLKIEAAKAPVEPVAPAKSKELEGKRRLFAKNIPYDATETEIRELFGAFGPIVDVRVPTSFGRCKGFAYVEFKTAASLLKAVKAGAELRGRKLLLDADSGAGPKAGFHYRPEAYEAAAGRGAGRGRGRGEAHKKPKAGSGKLPLF